MKGASGIVAEVLRPVLDTYLNCPVALTGCRSRGIERACCEVDAVVVTNEARAPSSIKLGETYCDLYFVSEKEALKPSNPEVAMALAFAKPIRDAGMTVSTSLAANLALFDLNAKKSTANRLARAIKALGRADEALSNNSVVDADFWLASAAYDFAYALLSSSGAVPAPSHLLSQLRERSRNLARGFETFTRSAGLGAASRKECSLRLEGLSLLYDFLGTKAASRGTAPVPSPGIEYLILKKKAEYLSEVKDLAENYSFTGLQVVEALPKVRAASLGGRKEAGADWALATSLTEGGHGLFSEGLVSDLGFTRSRDGVHSSLRLLKQHVAGLARRQ